MDSELYLLLPDRLIGAFDESKFDCRISIITLKDIEEGLFTRFSFDYQLPIGSLPSRLKITYTDTKPWKNCLLKYSIARSESLKRDYSRSGKFIVGISWEGGGRKDRIPLKSIPLSHFMRIFEAIDCTLVSLQYGDDEPEIRKWNNSSTKKIIHDRRVCPIKDLIGSFDQVASVDAVVSIANTTIHSAGGLGVPTFCLVSKNSDWRWIDNETWKGCYWYDCVDAGYQQPNGSWSNAFNECNAWLRALIDSHPTNDKPHD
jgi:hypothetical protein